MWRQQQRVSATLSSHPDFAPTAAGDPAWHNHTFRIHDGGKQLYSYPTRKQPYTSSKDSGGIHAIVCIRVLASPLAIMKPAPVPPKTSKRLAFEQWVQKTDKARKTVSPVPGWGSRTSAGSRSHHVEMCPGNVSVGPAREGIDSMTKHTVSFPIS